MNSNSLKDLPYFLELGKEYPVWNDDIQDNKVDKNLAWYFFGNHNRSLKELKELKKKIEKSLRERARELKKKNPKLRIAGIVHELWEKEYNLLEWQNKNREKKYVNNLEFVFNQIFCELVNLANLGDKSDQELFLIFKSSSEAVSSRMESIFKRNALNSAVNFSLPQSWKEGKELLSTWLIQDISDFSTIKLEVKNVINLQEKLKNIYGLEKINKKKNEISDFAKEIFEEKKLKKTNGEYYSYSSIRRELYNLLGRKE